MDGENEVRKIFCDPELNRFIEDSLTQSLSSIGYSPELLEGLFYSIKNLTIGDYMSKNTQELHRLHSIHFYNDLAVGIFALYVLPEIPLVGKVLDFGCGAGALLKKLSERDGAGEVVGADISSYSEWGELRKSGIRIEEITEKDLAAFIRKEQPDIVVMTWVLHHMDYATQERYLRIMYETMKLGSRIVAFEDSYSKKLPPEEGRDLYEDFMKLSVEDRKKVMGVFDWIANRILGQRETIPMPFGYRTLEEWQLLFKKIGFTIVKTRFVGFPKNRDVNNGQSVFVAVR